MNATVKWAVVIKHAAWKKWKKMWREEDKEAYKKKETAAKKMIRNRKNGWERDIARYRKTLTGPRSREAGSAH